MPLQVELPAYLSGLRRRVYGRQAAGWSMCQGCRLSGMTCTLGPHVAETVLSICDSPGNPIEAYRAKIQETNCQQVNFLLMLKAIECFIPARDLPTWMESPNPALGGRSPLTCIDGGQFEQVVDALALKESSSSSE